MKTAAEVDRVWDSLALDGLCNNALDLSELERGARDPIVLAALDAAFAVAPPPAPATPAPSSVQASSTHGPADHHHDRGDPVDDILAAAVTNIERQLRDAEAASVAQFVAEGPRLAELNHGMEACERTLAGIETVMGSLGTRLAGLSTEIRRLDGDTVAAAAAVEYRGAAEAHLSTFVDEVVLPPATVRHIVDGDVGGREYEVHLNLLCKKIAFLNLADTRASRAYQEVKPLAQKLLTRAVQKVADFLLDKVGFLRRPNTNVEIIKESVLRKYKYLFEFLHDFSPERFADARTAYISTMSRLYMSLFRRYVMGLRSLLFDPGAQGGELLASEVTQAPPNPAIAGLFAAMGAPMAGAEAAPVTQVFALGSRIDALVRADDPSLVLAVAVSNKQRICFESFHRSVGKMLLETCTAEHMFCAELFGEVPGRMFDDLFVSVVEFMLQEVIKAHISTTRDAIGVLLAMKINEAHRVEMKRRRIGDLSDYFVKADIHLKPKFKELFDANSKSLASAVPSTLLKDLNSTSPHIVTRRYAEFTASILTIISLSSGPEDSSLREGLKRMRNEYQALMNRMSALYPKPKPRYIFLINNDDLIISVMDEHKLRDELQVESPAGDQIQFFEEVLGGHVAAYVHHELSEHFSELITFTRDNDGPQGIVTGEAKARATVKEFAANWRVGLAHMRENIRREFPNFENGQDILKRLLAEVLSLHRKSEVIVDSISPDIKREMVPTSALVFEIRKFTNDF